MANHVAVLITTAAKVLSPKLKSGVLWGVLSLFAMAVLTAITPEMLAPLGAFAGMVQAVIATAVSLLAVYLKTDPLRALGAAVANEAAAPVNVPANDPAFVAAITDKSAMG